jgi:polyisoprenoid-binding protein YceI
MISKRRLALAVPVLAGLSVNASAEPDAYSFDKNHTEVRFCWNHLGVSRQCGHFLKFDGELLYDEKNPEKSSVNVSFKTDSIETFVPLLNEHMRGDKFFDAKKYPEITFKSTKFEKTGPKAGKVLGDLTIKGVTKSVTLDVTLNFAGAHPMSKKPSLGIGAVATVKRAEFGVSQFAPAVSDDISVEIQTELNKNG